jgi:acyl-CoA synthetase (AMP-forming)/AMP-acid ligase II
VKITGRIKDLIIRGGENIHPLEVENALFKHDLISEASVVGLPDEKYGECVAAFVVVHKGVQVGVDDAGEGNMELDRAGTSTRNDGGLKKTLTREEVRSWVNAQLSHHLVPKYVFWVNEYPKTASGKIQKFKLKELGAQMLKDAAARRQPQEQQRESGGGATQ